MKSPVRTAVCLDGALLRWYTDVWCTMKEGLKLLYELQKIDLEIDQTHKALRSLDGGASVAAEVAKAQKELDARETELRKARAELRDLELALSSAEEKRKGYRRKLESGRVTSHREQDAIQREIDALSRQIGEIEERALLLMDQIEPLEAKAQESRQLVEGLQARLAEVQSRHAQERERLTARLKELESARTAAAASVPEELMEKYNNVRRRFGPVAVALVEGNTCGACRISISVFLLRQLRDSDGIFMCDNCGRILYLPEEH